MMEYKSMPFEAKDYTDGKMQVSGYLSMFDTPDIINDIVKKGAFTRSIKANGPMGKNRIKYLFNHKFDQPIGRFDTLIEDRKGLYFEAKLFGEKGQDVYEMMKAGVITENSFGYKALDYDMNDKGGKILKELKMFEGSAVTISLHPDAKILQVKGMTDDSLLEIKGQYDKLANLLSKGNISDDLGFQLEGLVYKLKGYFEAATQPETPDVSLEPEDKNKPEAEFLMQLHKLF